MDEQPQTDVDVHVEAEQFDELDNFDLRTPAEVAESVEEAPEQEQPEAEEAKEESEEQPEEPAEKQEPKEEPKEEKPYQPPQRIKLPVAEFTAEIPVDEYGNIDPTKLGEYMQQRDAHLKEVAKIEAQNAYYEQVYGQREWNDVEGAYPELVKDETSRSLIESLRVADAIRGGEGSLMQAAKTFKSQLDAARNEARESAQSNITRQKSVTLKSSSRTQPVEANKIANLRKRAASGGADSEQARLSLLTELYESGSLNA